MGKFKELDSEHIYNSDPADLNLDFMTVDKTYELELYLQRKIRMLEELKNKLLQSETSPTSHL